MRGSSVPIAVDVAGQQRRQQSLDRALFALALVMTFALGAVAAKWAPAPLPIPAAILIFTTLAVFTRPALAVYIIVLFGLIGDGETLNWWPTAATFAQRESILFLHDSLAITPIEVVLGAAYCSLLTRKIVDRTWSLRRGDLFGPVIVFGGFVMLAAMRGIATANPNVTLLQARPLVYCIALYVLITNVFTSRRQYRLAFALALLGNGMQSIFTLDYYRRLPAEHRIGLESLGEHPSALIMNVVLLTFIALLVFKGSRWKRWAMLPLVIPVTYVYLLAQRRAAMVALIVGLALLAVMVYFRSRRLFWRFVPALGALGTVYIGATWNAAGSTGLASSAVKSMFFPGSLSAAEQASNLYRTIENYNMWATVRANFLFGSGFGRQFMVVQPMPNISAFELWQYFPHNSVLGMYSYLGLAGFVAALYMLGRAVQHGMRSALEQTDADDASMALVAATYPVMFLVFAFVDIAWGIRPLLMMGLCLAICADFARTPGPATSPRSFPPARGVNRHDVRLAA